MIARVRTPLLTALLLGAPVAEAASQSLNTPLPLDPDVRVGTLSNGLRYFIRVNDKPRHRAELRLAVNAGSVLEADDQQGLAHFVEHMAFNGTRNFAKQQLVDYLESIGVRFGPDVNAYTSFDETVYSLQVPTDSAGPLEMGFRILADWAHEQVFDSLEVEKERGVVIEEWRLGQGAAARMRDKQFPILFRGSRYAERLPLGKPEILRTFSHEAVRRFYRDWYRPDLMAVIAVGDFDPMHVEALIRRYFAGIPPARSPRPRPVYEVPDHEETLVAVATDPEATGSAVAVYYKQPVREHADLAAFRQDLVERLYNAMFNQRLFELTQRADPPFIFASSGQGRFVRSKEVYLLNAGVEDGGILRGLEALLTEAERVARFGFTASELEREKRELLRALERAYAERAKTESDVYAARYVRHFLTGDPSPGIEFEYRQAQRLLPSIQLEEINALARSRITGRSRVILANAPQKAGVSIPTEEELLAVFDAVRQKDITPYEDVVASAPLLPHVPEPAAIVRETTIPEIGVTEWELANGVRVVLKPTDFKADEVLFRAFSPGGTSLASDEDFISAALAAQAVPVGGVGSFSLVELQKILAGRAVHVSPAIGSLEEGLAGGASPRDLETLFQLIYLTVTAPRADTAAFTGLKSRFKAALANRSSSPLAAFQDTLQVTLSQGHFRARPLSAELLDELDLDRALAFYRDRFADAGDFTFVFVGSFDLREIRPLVQTYLGGLPTTGRIETWRNVGMDPPTGVIRKTVRKGIEPRAQTEIVFTGPFEYAPAELHALRSLADLLEIRLREVLREDLAGTYDVSVVASAARLPEPRYSFHIGFGSAPERVTELTDVVLSVIDSLKTAGPPESDVQKVREIQRRERETNLRQNGYWLEALVARYREGRDPRDILEGGRLIDALDAAVIQQAARRYLRTDNYVQVTLVPEQTTP
jgi:zinc protease